MNRNALPKRDFHLRRFVRVGRKTVLSLAGLLTLSSMSAGLSAWASSTVPPTPPGQVVNGPSKFAITVDGKFTDGSVVNNHFVIGNEWSDITPLAFISPSNDSGVLKRTDLADPHANSLLYAGLDPGTGGVPDDIYLMYDDLSRTDKNFQTGARIADIAFPITLPSDPSGIRPGSIGKPAGPTLIHVLFVQGVDGLEVNVNKDDNGQAGAFIDTAANLGMEFGLTFGPSTLSIDDHLLIELGVPLRIPATFGGIFGQAGVDPSTGLYSPDPQFWGASAANNSVDPPISAATFSINNNGSTVITPQAQPADTPEPSSWAFLTAGLLTLGVFGARRKRRQAAVCSTAG